MLVCAAEAAEVLPSRGLGVKLLGDPGGLRLDPGYRGQLRWVFSGRAVEYALRATILLVF